MAGKKRPARGNKRRGKPGARGVLKALLLLLLFGATIAATGLAILWPRCSGGGCPSIAALRTYTPPQATQVLDRETHLIASLSSERRVVVPLRRIPAHVSGAFLAVEDKRFYQHHGVDWRRALGALARDVRHRSWKQGFSTITMQLARNVFPEQLTRAKTLRRKLGEVVFAWKVEKAFRKDEILEMYLNQIYLGNGLYGVEAAAQGYFGKPVGRLSNAEAATIAALPKAPSYYDPRRSPELVRTRRNLVLEQMAHAGVISPAEAASAKDEPLRLSPPREASGAAPYFVAAVRRELIQRLGPDAETRGYRVYTTLDPRLQAAAQRELVKQVQAVEAGRMGRFRNASCSGRRTANPASCLQGLFVAMDPATGEVMALVGGRDYGLSQFDRVTQARRQAGSAFKPIVFAAALAQGIPITTPLLGPDATDSLGTYRPADHVDESANVDLRDALRLSSNRATVVLGNKVGVSRVVAEAKDLGLTTPVRPYPSSFIGAAEVVPLELVAAYSVFASGGTLVKPRLIRKVVDPDGQVVYQSAVERRFVLSPGVAFLTTSLMRDVVDRGTGSGVRSALPATIPAAGKTGTTDEGADVWFIGVTPDIVAGVWLGFDRPRAILADASGGGLAAPVWGRVVADFYQRHPAPAPWNAPPDLQVREVDRRTGQLATPYCPREDVVQEFFIAGTEPTQSCPLHPDGFGGGDSWLGQAVHAVGDALSGGSGDDGQQEPAPAPVPRIMPPPQIQPRAPVPVPQRQR
ncbi:MAG TPA: PBP1A family penicillin-binding protein [Longimicrobium sp.]|nr:PBP1A family penicillin-binding protein [Longimicrobium sp.]